LNKKRVTEYPQYSLNRKRQAVLAETVIVVGKNPEGGGKRGLNDLVGGRKPVRLRGEREGADEKGTRTEKRLSGCPGGIKSRIAESGSPPGEKDLVRSSVLPTKMPLSEFEPDRNPETSMGRTRQSRHRGGGHDVPNQNRLPQREKDSP